MAAGGESRRTALVTGITGQDGSFLAELLLEKGYAVAGMARDAPLGRSEHLRNDLTVVPGDLRDPESLVAAIRAIRPDELYHLAAPSFVPDSWEHPAETLAATAGATGTLLEAVRRHSPDTRAFVAGSVQMFGAAPESPQREDTPCYPENPYGTGKLAAYHLTRQLRGHDGLYACVGILYNHESERRPEAFVSRKITRAAAAIKLGLAQEVVLGDVDAIRDWSFAGDIVRGAWLMLQQPQPEDYILASGVPHTVAELAELAFAHVGLNAREHVRIDSGLKRAPGGTVQVGDPSHARERLGWKPTLSFEELIVRMVDADLRGFAADD